MKGKKLSVIMGNSLMQHRLAIGGFKMPSRKMSWRKWMQELNNMLKEERKGRELQREARLGVKKLVLPLVWIGTIVLPLLWMCSLYNQNGETMSLSDPIIPSSTACYKTVLEEVGKKKRKSTSAAVTQFA